MSPGTSHQLELFATVETRSPEALTARLAQQSGCAVDLTLTRNHVAMISVRFRADGARVRADRAFLAAPDAVLTALARYLRHRSRAAWRVVAQFARTLPPGPAPAPSRLATRGQVYDLALIRDRISARFFGGRLRCRITWGRAGPTRCRPVFASRCRRRLAPRRSIRFGSYVRAHDLVRIHPLLDDPRVPESFVEYIVFHEMLHAAVPVAEDGRRYHPSAFRALERRYPDLPAMRRLSAELVKMLG
jgi:hypothetical protein